MKKHMILLPLLLAVSAMSYAVEDDDDIVREIELRYLEVETRSVVQIPEANICRDVLSVCFDASGIYTLSVANAFGETVYTSTLPANGMEYSYDLSGIGEGMFTLVLEGPSGEYEGNFSL